MQNIFRRHIALPQDHGSWVFLFSPLLVGLFAGNALTAASWAVIIGALAAFLVRQPLTILVKIYAGRRARDELLPACFWLALYVVVGLAAASVLFYLGFGYILLLTVPAIPVFLWHLYLVGRRSERRQAGVEILATAVLALAAPAAYWAGMGDQHLTGWWLWGLTWLQSAASIVHAYLRLEQRAWSVLPAMRERLKAGFQALLWTTLNLGLVLVLGVFRILPTLIFLPFLLQWVETLWGTTNPALGAKPVAIGMRQLMVSVLFTLLFILVWR